MKIKSGKNAHTAKTKIGSGDFYGSGVKQPIGKMRVSQLDFRSTTPKSLKKPPKSLA